MKWLTIKQFPNYQISDHGAVRRIDTHKELAQNTKRGKHPYKRVHLSHKGVAKYVLVHRLVLEAFVGPCPDGMQTLHADDNPANNCLSNLSWGTPKRNHETIDRNGEANGRAKLTEADVREIRSSALSTKELAEAFNTTQKYIQNILRGVTWKCMTQN